MASTGVLSKWTKRGFGFITQDGTGAEIFVHKSELLTETDEDPDVGMPMKFDVVPHKDGKQKATNVGPIDGRKLGEKVSGRMAGMGSGMGLAGKVRAGGATRGKVKKWFEGRGSLPGGYGFVVPIEGEHAGKDIYIHHSSFGGGSLNLGWDINFDIDVDPSKEGRLRAINAGGRAVCGRGCRSQAPFKAMFKPYEEKKPSSLEETETPAPLPTPETAITVAVDTTTMEDTAPGVVVDAVTGEAST